MTAPTARAALRAVVAFYSEIMESLQRGGALHAPNLGEHRPCDPPRLIFQFMARALQSTTTGLLNFAQMPEKRGWDPIRPG